jgi:hypothetical protein
MLADFKDTLVRLVIFGCQFVLAAALVLGFLGLVNVSALVREGISWIAPFCALVLLVLGLLLTFVQICRSRFNWQLPFDFPKFPARLGWTLWPLLLGGAIILSLGPLVHAWTKLEGSFGSLGRYLPFSDALGYWQGAQCLEMQGHLDEWNCRRPLNALLLAVRLAIMGNDLRGALILQAVLLGFSCFLLTRSLAKDYGAGPGLLLFSILYAIAWDFIPSTQSEILGLTLGCLATAILWSAARDRRPGRIAFGLFILTLALNARAGAFLVLPALVMWAGLAFRKNQRWLNWRIAGLAFAAVAAGFVLNGGLRWYYGVGFGLGHGNFANTLYGFSTGHPDWMRIYEDHPEVTKAIFANEDEYNSYIYSCAWENIARSPFNLVRGYVRGMGTFLQGLNYYGDQLLALPRLNYLWAGVFLTLFFRFWWFHVQARAKLLCLVGAILGVLLCRRFLRTHGTIHFLFQISLLVGVVRFLWRERRDARTGLLLFSLLGFVLSGPIIWPDGYSRVLVASYPLFFLLVVLAPVGWSLPPCKTEEVAESEPASVVWLPLATSAGLLLAALIGPALAYRLEQAHPLTTALTRLDGTTWSLRTGPQTPYLEILAPGSPNRTFAPQIRDEDFSRVLARSDFKTNSCPMASEHLRGPVTVILAATPAPIWIIGPPGMIAKQVRQLRIKGTETSEGCQHFIFVSDWQPENKRLD